MTSTESIVRDLYRALGAGDAGAIDAILHPDFVGQVTEGLLDVGGIHAGPEAMRTEVWWRIGKYFRGARPEPEEFHPLADGGLLVLGRYGGQARESGGKLDAQFAHVFAFADGRIVRLVQLTDSQRWADALAGSHAPSPTRRELSAVRYEFADGLATVTLDNPAERNVFSEALANDVLEVALRLSEQPGLRAVLINADGPAFSLGGNLALFAAAEAEDLPRLLHRMSATFHQGLDLLWRLDAPIVCAVQGSVGGGGLGFLFVADLVLLADGAKLALGYGALGLAGDGGASWFLPRLVGPRRAAELYFEQRVLSADEAVEWGIANRIVPAEGLADEAAKTARKLANGPSRAYGEIRRLLHDADSASLPQHLLAEVAALTRTAATTDAVEGIAAFAAKRRPTFEGH